jgi:hypothetical protein
MPLYVYDIGELSILMLLDVHTRVHLFSSDSRIFVRFETYQFNFHGLFYLICASHPVTS